MAKTAAILVVIWLIFTWPFWVKGLIPAPLDFLVGFFAPWQGSYNLPIKNSAIPDVVNQIIPWKTFTISEWQQGRVPLWNPYNFSGTPHAANWQSAVFYPLNLIFMLLRFETAWSLYVLLQPLLAGIFTYLFVRSLKISPLGSWLSAISFGFSGFMTTWLAWGTLGHALLWLPAALWAVEKSKIKTALLFLSLSLLAGHLQTSLYVIILTAVYWYFTFKRRPLAQARGRLVKTLAILVIPFFLTAFQFFPSLELYFNSFRSQENAVDWFQAFRIPIYSLITWFAPDFFGHPVTRNQFTDYSYVEMAGYIGLIPLLLALLTLLIRSKSLQIKFFWWTIVISLALSLKTPVANLLVWLHVPVLSSSSPARIIALISFSLSILAGFGFDYLPNLKKSTLKKFLIGISLIFASFWLATVVLHLPVSQRNLILPTAIFILFTLLMLFRPKLLFATSYLLFAVTAGDLFRFHHKFTPYTDKKLWYPQMKFITFLQQNQGVNRSFGIFDGQLNLPFKIYSAEGYDTLFPKTYGRLLQLDTAGRVSSATIPKNSPQTTSLLNLLGVKYVVQGVVHGAAPWELQLWNYPDQFINVYEDERYQVFRNNKAQSRAYLINGGQAEITTYTPQKIVIEVDSAQNNTLILSDSYYPGWRAMVDDQAIRINLTNAALRGVDVPAGQHTVAMTYQSLSFTLGLAISIISLICLALLKMTSTKFLPYDVYSRHRRMAELVTAKGSILDVGGSLKELKRFVNNPITTVDVIGGDVVAAGTYLPFKNNNFDIVVSLDTIEHIPAKNRLQFISENLRVAKKQVIIAAPMGTLAHQQAEAQLLIACPKDHYLQEHIKYGLPSLVDIKNWVKDLPVHELSFSDDWRLARLMFKFYRFEVSQPQFNRLIHYGKPLINWLANTLIFPFTKDVAYTQNVNRFFLKITL